MDIAPYKAKLLYREMPSTKNAFDATKQVILKLCVAQARLTAETGSDTAVVPQTKLSTPEIAEEENEPEEEKEEASKQSHDELTSNQAIINIKLQKNKKKKNYLYKEKMNMKICHQERKRKWTNQAKEKTTLMAISIIETDNLRKNPMPAAPWIRKIHKQKAIIARKRNE